MTNNNKSKKRKIETEDARIETLTDEKMEMKSNNNSQSSQLEDKVDHIHDDGLDDYPIYQLTSVNGIVTKASASEKLSHIDNNCNKVTKEVNKERLPIAINSANKRTDLENSEKKTDETYSEIKDVFIAWSGHATNVFKDCPELIAQNISHPKKDDTNTANKDTYFISENLKKFRDLMNIMKMSTEADEIIVGLGQQKLNLDPSYISFKTLFEPFATIVAGTMTLPGVCDMLQENAVISRENLIQLINESARVYLLPILRDIKLCRHFGHEEEWYKAFYLAKHNDMLDCLPFISHKHGYKKAIETDAMSIDDQQSSKHKTKEAEEEEISVDSDNIVENRKRKRSKRVQKTKTNEVSDVSKEKVQISKKRKAAEICDDEIQEINQVRTIQKKTITQNTLEAHKCHYIFDTKFSYMEKKSAALAVYNFHQLVTNKLIQQLRIKVDENYLIWNDWCHKWDDASIIATTKTATTDNLDKIVNEKSGKTKKLKIHKQPNENNRSFKVHTSNTSDRMIKDREHGVILYVQSCYETVHQGIVELEEGARDDHVDNIPYQTLQGIVKKNMILFKKTLGYVKVGVSTEGEIKLKQRPATFQKDSEFLLMEHMPEALARSITDSLKFETFMFQQLEQAGIKKVGVEEKVSSRGEFYWLYDSNDKYVLEDIKNVVRRVAHTPFVGEVRNTRSVLYWPIHNLINDKYSDDLTSDCINQLSKYLNKEKRKNILVVGCSGGGYNTILMCKAIVNNNSDVCVTVIDRLKSKIDIARAHIIDMKLKNVVLFNMDFLDYSLNSSTNFDCIFCALFGSLSKIEALKLVALRSYNCKVYLTGAAREHVIELMPLSFQKLKKSNFFKATGISIELTDTKKTKNYLRNRRIFDMRLKARGDQLVNFAWSLRDQMLDLILKGPGGNIERQHKQIPKSNTDYLVSLDKKTQIICWGRICKWQITGGLQDMSKHLKSLRKLETNERNVQMFMWWMGYLFIPGIKYCTEKLAYMGIVDTDNIQKSFMWLSTNMFNGNHIDENILTQFCGKWNVSHDNVQQRSTTWENIERTVDKFESKEYLTTTLQSYGIKFFIPSVQDKNYIIPSQIPYNIYDDIGVSFVLVYSFKEPALAIVFGSEANMTKLDGIYGMLLIPVRNSNESDRSVVFKFDASEVYYSKITWIDEWITPIVITDSLNNESLNEDEFEELKAKAVVQWIINFNNALITNSSHMKLINMVSCTGSKQEYDAMILKASTKQMWDDLKTCAVSNTEISYEIRSSGKNRNSKMLDKSLSRIKSTVSDDERVVNMHSGEPMDVAPDTVADVSVVLPSIKDDVMVVLPNDILTVSNDKAEVDMYSAEPRDVQKVDISIEVLAPDNVDKSDGVFESSKNDVSVVLPSIKDDVMVVLPNDILTVSNDKAEVDMYSAEPMDVQKVDISPTGGRAKKRTLSEQKDNDDSKKSNQYNYKWSLLSEENMNQIISDASDQHKIDSDKESSGDAQNVDKSNRVFETQNTNENGVVRNVHSGGRSDAQNVDKYVENVDLVGMLPSVKDDVIVVLPNDILILNPLTKILFISRNGVNIKVIDALRVAGYSTSDSHARGWLEIDSVDYEINEIFQSLVPNKDIFAFSVHFYMSLDFKMGVVPNFSRGIDIFKMKYLYIPILIEKHYRLVCVIGLDQLTNDKKTEIVILVMDSLENDNNHIVNEISKFLNNVWNLREKEKKKREGKQNKNRKKEPTIETTLNTKSLFCSKLPKQNNSKDCGIFIIAYFNLATKILPTLSKTHLLACEEIDAVLTCDKIDAVALRKEIVDHYISKFRAQKLMCNRGLHNFGTTCFINVTLQTLLNIKSFSDYFLKNPPSEKNSFASVVQNFVENMSGTTENGQSSKDILQIFFNQLTNLNLPSRSTSVVSHDTCEISLDDMIRVALKPKNKRSKDSKELKFETDVIEALQCTIKLLFQCTQFQDYITNTFYPKYTQISRCSNCMYVKSEIIEHNEIFPLSHGFYDDTNLKELLCTQNEFKLDECSKCSICAFNSVNVDNKPYLEVRKMFTCPSSILAFFISRKHRDVVDCKEEDGLTDGEMYPLHSLDIKSRVLNPSENDSYMYDLVAVVHYISGAKYGESGHYRTTIPLDKTCSNWCMLDDIDTYMISGKVLSNWKSSRLLFYRRNEGYIVPSQILNTLTAVQHPRLFWYLSAPTSTQLSNVNNNIAINRAHTSLFYLKDECSLYHTCCSDSLAIHVLTTCHSISNGSHEIPRSACSVYLEVEKLISKFKEENSEILTEENDIKRFIEIVPSVSPGSMVWIANSDDKFMKCIQYRKSEDEYSNFDILIENNQTIKIIYTNMLTNDIYEGYCALAFALRKKSYLEWRIIEGTAQMES